MRLWRRLNASPGSAASSSSTSAVPHCPANRAAMAISSSSQVPSDSIGKRNERRFQPFLRSNCRWLPWRHISLPSHSPQLPS
ncbi:hypothetical protein D3C85_1482790 [compost metagenome]